MDNQADQPAVAAVPAVPIVYTAISAVQAELSVVGIGKDQSTNGNKTPNPKFDYNFRGIDDIYNALSGLLSKYKLLISPTYTDLVSTKRVGANDKIFNHATVTGHFDFISVVDGSKHRVTMIGEAQDGGDKSANKAMSAAYKYACLQVFCIPTQGDNDADRTPHEPADYRGAGNNQQGYPQDQWNSQQNNRTQIKDVQPIRNQHQGISAPQSQVAIPLRNAPLDMIAYVDGNQKAYTVDHLRIFNSQQFMDLEKAIISGAYKKDDFANNRYFYSQEQFDALSRLN